MSEYQYYEWQAIDRVLTWRGVEELIERKQPKAYDTAVAFLQRLRELAECQGRLPEFEGRVAEICSRYSRRPALMARLDRAGL